MIQEEQIRSWIEAYDRNGYLHGSILIASAGKMVVNQGFGMANWEHEIPNSPVTKFRIGSITKAFTAMCIFQLHEKQNLDLNDSIGTYLPDYPNGDRITIYHCLTNSAGIPNYTSFPDFWTRTMRLPSTLAQLIDSFKDRELEFEPGSEYRYSNSGYALLTAIIEHVSGMSYADYIEEHICRPLGMKHTGCDDGMTIVPGLASGYSFWEKPIHAAYADMSFPLGAYGLYSTTEDLYIWDQALRANQLIGEDLMEKMFTPYRGSYAYGWMVSSLFGRSCVNHFGDISGFSSDFIRFNDPEVTIVFASNMNVTPVTQLTRDMAKVMFGENADLPLPAVPIPFTGIESVVGDYVFERDMDKAVNVSVKNQELYVTVPKMYGACYKFKLIPIAHDSAQTTFVTEMIHEKLVFSNMLSSKCVRLAYTDYYGKQHLLHRRTE